MKEVKWAVAAFGVVLMFCCSAYGAAPNAPSSPDPTDGAVGAPRTVELSWVCSDDDDDYLFYEIWMRRVPENWQYPLKALDLFQVPTLAPIEGTCIECTEMTCPPGQCTLWSASYTLTNLMPDTTYVWRVRAIEDKAAPEKRWGPRWTFTTDDSTDITTIAPNPARAGRMIIMHGYGFLAGTPQFVGVGKRKFFYRESDRIIKWTDDEIWFTLPGFKGWDAGTVKTKKIRVRVVTDEGPQTAKYRLEIYKDYYPAP